MYKTLFMKNLHIPEPCSEDWESMSPKEKGRFCSVCNKCVIDFTQKNPLEIRQIIDEKRSTDVQVCGRFYDYQLNTSDVSKRIESRFLKYIPAGFRNSRMVLGIFSFLLFLTGCSKPKPEVYATTGVVVEIEEDSPTAHKSRIADNDSIGKMPRKNHTAGKEKLKKEADE
ncbi:hypothetical protein EGY05_17780 [Chryseobacterium arthrosphaerae]|nr:hypothetical protein EGY05_17780 [Chryseobacterium arthrosphaerae]